MACTLLIRRIERQCRSALRADSEPFVSAQTQGHRLLSHHRIFDPAALLISVQPVLSGASVGLGGLDIDRVLFGKSNQIIRVAVESDDNTVLRFGLFYRDILSDDIVEH